MSALTGLLIPHSSGLAWACLPLVPDLVSQLVTQRVWDAVHLPNSLSVVPAFQAARFDYDDTYQEFAKTFGLKLDRWTTCGGRHCAGDWLR